MTRPSIYLRICLVSLAICLVQSRDGAVTIAPNTQKYHTYVDSRLAKVHQAFQKSFRGAKMIARHLRQSALSTEENVLIALRVLFDEFDAQVDKLRQNHRRIKGGECKWITDDCKRDFFDVLMTSSFCLTEKLDETASYVDNMRFIYDNLVEESNSVKNRLQECFAKEYRNDTNACIEKMTTHISQINTSALIAQIEEMYHRIKEAENEMKECYVQSSIDTIKDKIPEVVEEMRQCMSKL